MTRFILVLILVVCCLIAYKSYAQTISQIEDSIDQIQWLSFLQNSRYIHIPLTKTDDYSYRVDEWENSLGEVGFIIKYFDVYEASTTPIL